RACLLGDLPKLVELERARIRGGAAEDCARPDLARLLPRRVVVDPLRLRVEAVVVDLKELPGEVHGGAVGQVPALRERERHDAVAGTEEREVGRHVRLRPGVRLHVRMLGAEQRLRPVDRKLLDLVDDLAAAVIAFVRQPLRVLVGERGTLRLQHRLGDEVLAGDQLQPLRLPLRLFADEARDLGIDLLERFFHRGGRHVRRFYHSNRWNATTALVPPNPNEFESAVLIRTSRAWFGTTSTSHSGSWSSTLIVGGTIP